MPKVSSSERTKENIIRAVDKTSRLSRVFDTTIVCKPKRTTPEHSQNQQQKKGKKKEITEEEQEEEEREEVQEQQEETKQGAERPTRKNTPKLNVETKRQNKSKEETDFCKGKLTNEGDT
eukprot:GHVT01081713.1.p3 GENE.GHVT01081713.1~~GHVT01081713.1.p3  ORF type:complete len:120 (-),score=30.45 GHVT01081713.1:196-555(-)